MSIMIISHNILILLHNKSFDTDDALGFVLIRRHAYPKKFLTAAWAWAITDELVKFSAAGRIGAELVLKSSERVYFEPVIPILW